MSSTLAQSMSTPQEAMASESFGGIQATLAADVGDESAERGGPDRTVMKRVASIMEAFNRSEQALTLAEIGTRTGLPKSTVHRLADQLCQVGWIERDPGGYRVGLRMFELGGLATEGSRLRDVALPHLQALAYKTGMSTQLGILDEGEVVYLERIVVGSLRLPTRRGGRHPAYCTGLGKAMAAYDDEVIQAMTFAELPRRTSNTITNSLVLRAEFSKIRQAGVAFDRGEAFDDLVCVAAPIRGTRGAIGAVSVTLPAGRMPWGTATDAVRHAATAIWNANVRGGQSYSRS